jgi:hypothetical protein
MNLIHSDRTPFFWSVENGEVAKSMMNRNANALFDDLILIKEVSDEH